MPPVQRRKQERLRPSPPILSTLCALAVGVDSVAWLLPLDGIISSTPPSTATQRNGAKHFKAALSQGWGSDAAHGAWSLGSATALRSA